ncbi:MAG: hypothetical protein IPO60_18180 [Flavobacteriales bacterium]|nr:hypothetical protein [Flavobacteriales bacterium]
MGSSPTSIDIKTSGGTPSSVAMPGLAQPQNVRAVSDFGGSIYAVGYTTMPNGAPGNYFPLDGEENAGYFFNPLYNYNGLLGGASDAFITQFCDESIVGVAENQAVDRSGFRAFWTVDGVLNLLNLSDGPHQLRVYDPRAAWCWSGSTQCGGSQRGHRLRAAFHGCVHSGCGRATRRPLYPAALSHVCFAPF